MTLFSRLLSWFARFIGRGPWLIEVLEDMPDVARPNRVYLVGEPGSPWAAAFLCPCGCDDLVKLSLLSEDDPSWIASGATGDQASLHPSIWRIRGCRSHFFIKAGKVIWAKEERPDRRIVA